MANWSKQFKQIDTINSGQEYTLNDYVTLDMVNAPLNNTQYLYDVLYTTNTGLIAKVNQNTTDIATNTANITSVTNSLNDLKDKSTTGGNITYRGMIRNSASLVSLEVDKSQPNEYYYRYENYFTVTDQYADINLLRYYGDDSDELIYNFNFNQNGLTLMNSAGQSATLTVEKINQHLYKHDITISGDSTFGGNPISFKGLFTIYSPKSTALTSSEILNYCNPLVEAYASGVVSIQTGTYKFYPITSMQETNNTIGFSYINTDDNSRRYLVSSDNITISDVINLIF